MPRFSEDSASFGSQEFVVYPTATPSSSGPDILFRALFSNSENAYLVFTCWMIFVGLMGIFFFYKMIISGIDGGSEIRKKQR